MKDGGIGLITAANCALLLPLKRCTQGDNSVGFKRLLNPNQFLQRRTSFKVSQSILASLKSPFLKRRRKARPHWMDLDAVILTFVSSYSHIKMDVPAAVLCCSTVDPFPAVKYWWTFSAGSATDGCRPERKAPEQVFAAGPGNDEARAVHHQVVHCGWKKTTKKNLWLFSLLELYCN